MIKRAVIVVGLSLLLPAGAGARTGDSRDRFADVPSATHRRDLGSYALDRIERRMAADGSCPDVPLVRYSGSVIPYARSVRIHPAFVPRVEIFERHVRDAAIEVYGRAPRRLVHRGAYNCRPVRGFPELLSEHGLGNALDWSGADFGALRRGDSAPEDLPRALRRSFSVRVAEHYRATRGLGAVHARFLQALRARLVGAQELPGVLGPGYPGHEDHFHIDVAPWTLHYLDELPRYRLRRRRLEV